MTSCVSVPDVRAGGPKLDLSQAVLSEAVRRLDETTHINYKAVIKEEKLECPLWEM